MWIVGVDMTPMGWRESEVDRVRESRYKEREQRVAFDSSCRRIDW